MTHKSDVSYLCADAFLGPLCDYVLGPVARFAGVWGLPVLTAGGLVESFSLESDYPTLTRMMGSYVHVGKALKQILLKFNWTTVGLLFYNHPLGSLKGNSKCHFTLQGVYVALDQKAEVLSFNLTGDDASKKTHYFRELLTVLSKKARSEFNTFLHDFTSNPCYF